MFTRLVVLAVLPAQNTSGTCCARMPVATGVALLPHALLLELTCPSAWALSCSEPWRGPCGGVDTGCRALDRTCRYGGCAATICHKQRLLQPCWDNGQGHAETLWQPTSLPQWLNMSLQSPTANAGHGVTSSIPTCMLTA